MNTSSTDSWATSRKSFADQFEQDGGAFIYRRSQKGEAIRVSAEERSRFIDEFNRNLRRGMWIMYVGMTLALGGVILFSVLRGSDLSQAAIFIGIGIAVIPYFAFTYWIWGAPARELAGRTPVAGERSPDEVRQLRFQRITYANLGLAALSGLALPFFVSGRLDVFSGWNRLSLAFSGALVLFVAIRAFQKWRFEQQNSLSNTIAPMSNPVVTDVTRDSASPQSKTQLWRYAPMAILVVGLAFIELTNAGKQLAQRPVFWPIFMLGIGGWALFTVTQGFAKGRIEPMVRGLHNTYERDEQPKRFWASMTWNALLGGFIFLFGITGLRDAPRQAIQDRCYNAAGKYQAQEVLTACDQVIESGASSPDLTMADAFLDRGIARADLNDSRGAINDYSQALRLQPRYFEAHFDRGLAELDIGDNQQAIADLSVAIRLKPDGDAYLNRGAAYARSGDLTSAIADFSQVTRLMPKRADGYYYRAMAYRQIGETNKATADFGMAFRLNPKLCGGCRASNG